MLDVLLFSWQKNVFMADLRKVKFFNRQHIICTFTSGHLYGSAYLQEGMSVYYVALIESFFAFVGVDTYMSLLSVSPHVGNLTCKHMSVLR